MSGIAEQEILPGDAKRIVGDEAQAMDVAAGRAVADAVRTTLGPRGMDKMLVDEEGEFLVTNDGVTVLREMDIEHPAANMVVEAADAQEEAAGDGTTTAVVLAGELLGLADGLLDRGVHPSAIVRGYREAADIAAARLDDLAEGFDPEDRDALERLAATAMTGKGDAGTRALAGVVVEAALRATDEEGFDTRNVSVEPITGGSVADSTVVDGVAVGREPVHEMMPDRVDDAAIALVSGGIGLRESETATAKVSDPAEIDAFYEREEAEVRALADRLLDTGADVAFVEEDVHERVRQLLADAGVLCVRRTSREDLEALVRATGGTIADLEELDAADLGRAGRVEQRETGHDEHLIVEEVPEAEAVTVFLRGGSRQVVDELDRAVEDALRVLELAVEEARIVPGGGAAEAAIAGELRDRVDGVRGREQLAVEAFSDAVEVVPWTLAKTAGMDALEALLELRSRHDAGESGTGIDAAAGELADMRAAGVVEPARVKARAIEAATDAACMLLRIDAVVATEDLSGGAVESEDVAPDEVSDEVVQQNEEFIEDFDGG